MAPISPIGGDNAETRGREQGLQFAAVEISGGEAAGGPEEGGEAGDDQRQAPGTALHGLQHLAEIGAVVIGGAARQAAVGIPGLGLRRLDEQVVGRRRRDLRAIAGAGRLGAALRLGGADRFLDGLEGVFGQVRGFLRDIRHSVVASSLRRTIAARTVALRGPRRGAGTSSSRG